MAIKQQQFSINKVKQVGSSLFGMGSNDLSLEA